LGLQGLKLSASLPHRRSTRVSVVTNPLFVFLPVKDESKFRNIDATYSITVKPPRATTRVIVTKKPVIGARALGIRLKKKKVDHSIARNFW